jgi:biotin transporter BioY
MVGDERDMFILLSSVDMRGATRIVCLSSRSFVGVIIIPLAALMLVRIGVPAFAGLVSKESTSPTFGFALEFAFEGVVIGVFADLAKLLCGHGAVLIVDVTGDAVGK